jgi:S-formylglutathione hydrolase FrmB
MIIVMPSGADTSFGDTEWANGVASGAGWETYLARDVVGSIGARYRTIPRGWARAIGGLSEGGYGAINTALHHPGEFDTVESWSGYELAQDLPAVFGDDPQIMDANSPLVELPAVADTLRRDGVRFWFYSSTGDRMRFQNLVFARQLGALGISHRYFVVDGPHNWTTWRPRVPAALIVASRDLRPRRILPRA